MRPVETLLKPKLQAQTTRRLVRSTTLASVNHGLLAGPASARIDWKQLPAGRLPPYSSADFTSEEGQKIHALRRVQDMQHCIGCITLLS